jgi:hypothetical protein
MAVRGELYAVRKPLAEIVHQHQRELGLTCADEVADKQLALRFDRSLGPAIASGRVTRSLARGAVFLFDRDETPNLIALHSLRLHAAHMLIVIRKRDFASIAQQLIDRVDRTPDDPLDRAH